MSKFITLALGAAEVTAGVILTVMGVPIGPYLIVAGASTMIAGVGTLLSKGPVTGFATSQRNPTAPWRVIYGRARTGGTIVYVNEWGDDDKMLDLVVVIAAHACEAIDVLLFDQQRIQIDTSAAPSGAAPGSGTSFTPVQQHVNISEIKRVKGVAFVTLTENIPYLIEGDQINVAEDGAGTLTANALIGTFQVAQILSDDAERASGTLRFTFLSGGNDCDLGFHGHVNTLWADYGRKIYFEPLGTPGTNSGLGTALGFTFVGMSGTPYDGDMGNFVNPDHQGGLGGDTNSVPNPWTSDCSLQGKTAVFLRLHYSDKYFRGGIPQISFIVRGKNDILDPRTSPPTIGYTENAALCIADFLSNNAWGFKAAYGTEIDLPDLIAAANTCDEAVPLAISTGSPPLTEPAYTCNGQFELTMKRGEILQNLLTSCAGRITYIGGKFAIWPAAWIGNSFAIGSDPGSPVVPLGDFTAIAAGPVQWKPTVPIRELYNGVKGTYISKANKWMASDFPPYAQDSTHGYNLVPSVPPLPEGDSNLAADGGERRWFDIQLPFTISASAAQRIAKIELLRRRHPGTGTLILNMQGYRLTPMDLGLATIPFLGWGFGSPPDPKQLEIQNTRLRLEEGRAEDGAGPMLVVELDVKETDPSIYEWSTSEELSPQGYVQPAIPGVGSFQFFATENVPGFTVPFPWSPGFITPLIGDAVYPGPIGGSPLTNLGYSSFGLKVTYGTDAAGRATAFLDVSGFLPPNELSGIHPPQITVIVGTSGNLPPGRYVVAASVQDGASPPHNSLFSTPQFVTIPQASPPSSPPGGTGSITVNVAFPFGAASTAEIYLGQNDPEDGYFYQGSTPNGTPFVITDFDRATYGGPDPTIDHLAIALAKVAHGGVWAQQIQDLTSDTLTIAGEGMTTDQWAGYTATLIGKLDSTQSLIILNLPIVSSSASVGGSPPPALFTLTVGPNSAGDQVPDLTTLLVVGDLIVMRFNTIFAQTGFLDPNIANPYYPEGATNIEAGHRALVLTGPDMGDLQTIASMAEDEFGNETIVVLAGKWKIQPNPGDLVTVLEAGWGPETHTHSFTSPARQSITGLVESPQVPNLAAQYWAILVRSQTVEDINGLDMFAPVREIYVYGSQGTRTIIKSQFMLPTDRIIDADATNEAGGLFYYLLPFSSIPNQGFYIQKIDASPHPVQVICAGSPAFDLINGHSHITLKKQWDSLAFFVSGNG